MAEGIDEAENNSGGEATDMLSAAMPCEANTSSCSDNINPEFKQCRSITPTLKHLMPSIKPVQPVDLKTDVSKKFYRAYLFGFNILNVP